MTRRARVALSSLGACLCLWVTIGTPIKSLAEERVSVKTMLAAGTRYFPHPCVNGRCTLTGPGGIVQVWRVFVDGNTLLHRTFIVEDYCASACFLAYEHALSIGANVTVSSGTRMIPHTPSQARWQ